jgi:hypothetical protein
VIRSKARRTRYSALALSLLFAACAKGDKPATDTTAAGAGTQARALASVPAAAPAAMPGTLTKAIDAYTPQEFYDFVRKLPFDSAAGHERERDCKDAAGCSGNNPSRTKTKVRVTPITGQDSIGPSNTPEYGVVYIRAVNKGKEIEARYGLKPKDKNLEYYVIVQKDSTGTGNTWRLAELNTAPGKMTLTTAGSGKFTSCKHPWKKGAGADFKTCADTATAMAPGVMKMGLAFQAAADTPMWATCMGGCCLVDPI